LTNSGALNGPYRVLGGRQMAGGFYKFPDGGHWTLGETANGTNSIHWFVWTEDLFIGVFWRACSGSSAWSSPRKVRYG
jgi:hypothetical protein